MATFKKYVDEFLGSRVEMTESDGWAMAGWTGIVIQTDRLDVVVRWDNGKTLNHMKKNLRMMTITEQDDPNIAFKMHKFHKFIMSRDV